MTELWQQLGFDELRRVFRRTRHTTDIEALIRLMVFNRLCDPESKLGVLRWLKTVALPGVDPNGVAHQQLLRSMDALIENQPEIDKVVAKLLRPLVDQDLSVVFYDLTTIRSEGATELADDVRQSGMSKEGLIARQFMLGVVQTADGIPIYHEVFDGNTAETKTLLPTLTTVLDCFPSIRRLVLVADRGLLSLDNLDELMNIRLKTGQPLEFIVAVPGRRYSEFADLLADAHQKHCAQASEEFIGEIAWHDLRLIVAHNPEIAAAQTQCRADKIKQLTQQADAWAGKLDGQEAGGTYRGRKLSDSGAKARFFSEVRDARLSKIIKVDLKGELFSYDIDDSVLRLAQMMDGKLLLVTNVTDMRPKKVVERYKSLADIERGFRVLKSEIEIGPVHHRLPNRIRAHAAICFIALILHRVLRTRLKQANSGLSPERLLEQLRAIQHHKVKLNGASPITGVSTLTSDHSDALAAIGVKKPAIPKQLSLL